MDITLLCDTRQKVGKHDKKHEFFSANGIRVIRTKLLCGDYTLPKDQSISVDTKKDCVELYGDLIQDHERFRNECILAKECGIRLVILVENELGFTKPEDIMQWKNPQMFRWWKSGKKGKPPAPNLTLLKIMHSMTAKYGCEFRFCNSTVAGREIINILTEGIAVGQHGLDKSSQEDS